MNAFCLDKRKPLVGCGETHGMCGNTFVGQGWREGLEGGQEKTSLVAH